ncbi:nucleoporin NUP2 Ecym_8342 [Eremothecium cymbalariae DBVPG|uniref:RanBD1 domain-containing protein n=1 Tax=Eremothecium cymbalariae (strain CBS 270.75 / DBVPG 7215 / KCTC 17166 / NRRL Y-17582) TaxID=931890 RepID=G8JXP5_ERECY|nr:Hypothetical protein Ecym_8342 [Eremothecium cymbalariae DBVPG\
MAKRIAGSQITRETFVEDNDTSDECAVSGPSIASESTMRTRKIAMPKRKMGPNGTEGSFGNAFAFAKKPVAEGVGEFSVIGEARAVEGVDGGGDKHAKLQALNLKFQEKISQAVRSDPFVNLTPVLEKYQSYMSGLRGPVGTDDGGVGSAMQGTSGSRSMGQDDGGEGSAGDGMGPISVNSDSHSGSEDEKEDDIRVQGPKFVVSSGSTAKDSVFSFGSKKRDRRDSDSESDIEIKGPSFTFSGTVSSDVFKLKGEQETAEESKDGQSDPVSKSFVFKTSNNGTTSDGQQQPVAAVASPGSPESPAPSESPAPPATATLPIFGISSSSTAAGNTQSNTQTKMGMFGQGSTSKPSFSFGIPAAKALTTADTEKGQEAPQPIFNFGSSTDKQPENTNQGFTFNLPAAKGENTKASFTFGSTAPAAASNATTTISNNSNVPSFSFGASNNGSDNNKQETNKASFNFGKTVSSAAPSFNFGPKSDNSFQPSNNFKFSLPFAQNSIAFGNADKSNTQLEHSKNTSEVSAQVVEQADEKMNLENGEENENALFSERAKLMIFDNETKSYKSRGLGELKVLQKQDNKSKVRILCRSDGMGHILLNTSIVKSFKYEPLDADNDNLVKCPVVTDGKLETFVIRVKQKADGRRLANIIAEVQETM